MEEGDDMQLTIPRLPPKALFLNSITMEIASDLSQWAQTFLEGLFFSLSDI